MMTTREVHAEMAAQHVRDLIVRLHRDAGLPIECVLAGAHAEIVAAMATLLGGQLTAQQCRRAAEQIESIAPDLPSSLAVAKPAGSA